MNGVHYTNCADRSRAEALAPGAGAPALSAARATAAVVWRDPVWAAVGLVLAANVLLPLQDALTKLHVNDLPVWQVLLARSATILALAFAIGGTGLAVRMARARRKQAMLLRSVMNLAAWGCYVAALKTLPLGQAITIYFVSPIIVALIAGPILGERSGPAHWAALLLGFFGVALASGAAQFEISAAVGYAFLAACLWAVSLLLLRSVAAEEGTIVQVGVTNLVFVLACALPLLWDDWTASLSQTLGAALIGVVGGAGQFAVYEAARRLAAPALAALEYGAIISGFALGWLMFGDIPSATVAAGAALVVVSGVLIVTLERRRGLGLAPLARSDIPLQETTMSQTPALTLHDRVVTTIARTRFPFPGQTTWAADYVTLTNAPLRTRSIPLGGGEHFPDIVIVDGTGRVREIGEVEMGVDPASLPYLKAGSELADDDTPTKVRHFFLYVPAGMEAAAQALLEDNGISYAGVRGFTLGADGSIGIAPFVTKGDPYDHQITPPAAA